jgi:hypothetical protein
MNKKGLRFLNFEQPLKIEKFKGDLSFVQFSLI